LKGFHLFVLIIFMFLFMASEVVAERPDPEDEAANVSLYCHVLYDNDAGDA
jgi:hypothetical protein